MKTKNSIKNISNSTQKWRCSWYLRCFVQRPPCLDQDSTMKCPSPRKMPTTTLKMAQHEPDLVPTRPKMAQRKPNMVPTFPNAGPTLHNMTQNETDTAQHGAPNSAMWLKSAPPSCSANQKLALHTLYALPPTPSPRAKLHQLPALFQRFPSSVAFVGDKGP